jgi:class 3 adenylate cyclase
MEFLNTLHRNFSWLVVLFAVIAISAGFIELRRTQIELTEKNELLAGLSSQLAKFLPPQLYNSIFAGTHTTRVAAQRKKLTVFFSDIANFTETADSLESEELTNLLNQYLTEMSKVAVSHGATIDKYVGDAIMAFFGDPASRGSKEDAIACVKMAIAMQQRMRELQLKWLDLGSEKPFQLRIGINTGFCSVGNFGSEDRLDYTIIGNEVNLAARLQSHAEPGGILVTHGTASLIKDTIPTEEQGAVSMKGFGRPVRVYRILGIYNELEQNGRII